MTVTGGLITFAIGAREYAAALSSVREVLRLEGLADLPGMTPPLAGVVDLRGAALPVLDLRLAAAPGDRGDVLVLEGERDGALVGVAVDRVRAVVEAGVLAAGSGPRGEELPRYVLEVLRSAEGPVFLVDLGQMLASARVAA